MQRFGSGGNALPPLFRIVPSGLLYCPPRHKKPTSMNPCSLKQAMEPVTVGIALSMCTAIGAPSA